MSRRLAQIVVSVTPELHAAIEAEHARRCQVSGIASPRANTFRALLVEGLRRSGVKVDAPKKRPANHHPADCACRWYDGARKYQCAACAKGER